MSYEEQNTLIGKILFIIGSISGFSGFTLQEFDLYLGIFLKFLSVISFILFVIINYKTIVKNYKEIKNLWKTKK